MNNKYVKFHNELNAILLRAWMQMKMGEQNGLCIMNSEQLNYNSEYYSSVKCLSCSDLESQLKEALLEISSLQYIIFQTPQPEMTLRRGGGGHFHIVVLVPLNFLAAVRYVSKSSACHHWCFHPPFSYCPVPFG